MAREDLLDCGNPLLVKVLVAFRIDDEAIVLVNEVLSNDRFNIAQDDLFLQGNLSSKSCTTEDCLRFSITTAAGILGRGPFACT